MVRSQRHVQIQADLRLVETYMLMFYSGDLAAKSYTVDPQMCFICRPFKSTMKYLKYAWSSNLTQVILVYGDSWRYICLLLLSRKTHISNTKSQVKGRKHEGTTTEDLVDLCGCWVDRVTETLYFSSSWRLFLFLNSACAVKLSPESTCNHNDMA